MSSATLYTVSAPSGAGKTSLVNALTQADKSIHVSISHTTRAPRPGEVDGVNYHFTDKAAFEQMISEQKFLEHAEVFGNYYGTSGVWAQQQLDGGSDVLLEIDWQGAAQVKQLKPDTVAIFILPPSVEELKNRLNNRGQDSQEVINKRLAEAQNEMQHAENADFIVINDDFDTALAELKAIFCSQRLKTALQLNKEAALIQSLLAPM